VADESIEEQFNTQADKVLDYAKKISNDPELLKRLAEEEDKYLKATNEINYDDIIKADKERWLKSFEDDEEFMDEVEESGMTLEEYMEKNDIKYDDTLKQRAIENRKKENNNVQTL
jgi:dihydropteroate synthase